MPPSFNFLEPPLAEQSREFDDDDDDEEEDFLERGDKDDRDCGNTLLRDMSIEAHMQGEACQSRCRKRTWKVGVQPARTPVPASMRPQ